MTSAGPPGPSELPEPNRLLDATGLPDPTALPAQAPSDTPALPAAGEWRRLHPATPLLKGGIAVIAILGFVLSNLRERLIDTVVGGPADGDLLEALYRHEQLGWALLIVLGGLSLGIAWFFLSWRMHTFRITDEAVEVRLGILFRTHRKARLDRIQGVAITRPLFARLFGAARLELNVAGQDAKVQLEYLRGSDVDRMRHDILLLASSRRIVSQRAANAPDPAPGARIAAHSDGPETRSRSGELLGQRVSEFFAPELDVDAAPPESVVRIPLLRIVGSLLASAPTVILVVGVTVLVVSATMGRQLGFVFLVIPTVLGAGGFFVRTATRSLRFSIAATSDGIRVGHGLLTLSNDTLPPGRIHAVEVVQPLLWRPFGWWRIRINRAGHASSGSGVESSVTMLPVGTRDDVEKVLGLLLPGLAEEETRRLIVVGMVASGRDGFTPAPPRGAWLRPFSWRRTGYAETSDAVLIRKGVVWRQLVVVPLARIQSLRLGQGPVLRALDLAELTLHTVAGPVRANMSILARAQAIAAFESIAHGAVRAASNEDDGERQEDPR